MATKILITGNSKGADAALDEVISRMDRGDLSARKMAGGLDQTNASLQKVTTNAKAAGAALQGPASAGAAKMGTAASGMGSKVVNASSAIAGLGSALGVQGAGLAGAAAGLGKFGIAVGAVGVAVASSISIYKDLTQSTHDLGEADNIAAQFLRDRIIQTELLGAANLDLLQSQSRSDSEFQKNQAARFRARSAERTKAKAQAEGQTRGELSQLSSMIKAEKERLTLQRFAARAASRFGTDRERGEQKLNDLVSDRADLFDQLSKASGKSRADHFQRLRVQEAIKINAAEEAAIASRLVDLGREQADLSRQEAVSAKEHISLMRSLGSIEEKASRDRVNVLRAEKKERQDQLALIFQAKDAAKPDADSETVRGGGGGGGLQGGIGAFFGQAGLNIGGPRARRSGGGGPPGGGPGGVAGNILGGISRKRLLGGVTANRIAEAQSTGADVDEQRIRRDTFKGGASGSASPEEIARVQKEIAAAEIDKLAKQDGSNQDLLDAMKTQLAAVVEQDRAQAQMKIDLEALKQLASAVGNNARGRRQRSGR